jgi:hypothetical protein
MVIPARVTKRGNTVPAYQIDERFAEEVRKRNWNIRENGRLAASFLGETILLSRFIWLLHTGEWPKQEIDHINRDPLDNRVANLRDVSRSENNANRTPLCQLGRNVKKRSDLPTGVRFDQKPQSRPYRAQVRVSGKTKHLGCFATPEEASAAYLAEVQRLRACCPSGT